MINSIYDPFDLSGPAVIPAKKIFQESCRLKLDRDDELPKNLNDQWNTWLKDLLLLETYKIPRYANPSMLIISRTVLKRHMVLSVSLESYRQVHSCPLIFKAGLAPMNNTTYRTIPRIELNAAKLSIILKQIINEELKIEIN